MVSVRKSNQRDLSQAEMDVRSLLMRLYRSRLDGEAYYPAQFVTCEEGCDFLESQGWIERRGDGWRITEMGVKAWAHLASDVLNATLRLAWQNELQHIMGKGIIRLQLNPTANIILKKLVEHGGELPLAVVEQIGDGRTDERRGLETLMNAVYVVNDGEKVWLTDVGRVVLADPDLKIAKRRRNKTPSSTDQR